TRDVNPGLFSAMSRHPTWCTPSGFAISFARRGVISSQPVRYINAWGSAPGSEIRRAKPCAMTWPRLDAEVTANLAPHAVRVLVADIPHGLEVALAVCPEGNQRVRRFDSPHFLNRLGHKRGQIVMMRHADHRDEVI